MEIEKTKQINSLQFDIEIIKKIRMNMKNC